MGRREHEFAWGAKPVAAILSRAQSTPRDCPYACKEDRKEICQEARAGPSH